MRLRLGALQTQGTLARVRSPVGRNLVGGTANDSDRDALDDMQLALSGSSPGQLESRSKERPVLGFGAFLPKLTELTSILAS